MASFSLIFFHPADSPHFPGFDAVQGANTLCYFGSGTAGACGSFSLEVADPVINDVPPPLSQPRVSATRTSSKRNPNDIFMKLSQPRLFSEICADFNVAPVPSVNLPRNHE